MPHRPIRPRTIPCTFRGCERQFRNNAGLTNHLRTHENISARPTAAIVDVNSAPPSPALGELAGDEFPGAQPRPPSQESDEYLNAGRTVYHPILTGSYFIVRTCCLLTAF